MGKNKKGSAFTEEFLKWLIMILVAVILVVIIVQFTDFGKTVWASIKNNNFAFV